MPPQLVAVAWRTCTTLWESGPGVLVGCWVPVDVAVAVDVGVTVDVGVVVDVGVDVAVEVDDAVDVFVAVDVAVGRSGLVISGIKILLSARMPALTRMR